MNYKELYKQKKVSVEEALSKIHSGDVIATSLCANEPSLLFSHLHEIAGQVENVRIQTALNMGMYDFLLNPEYKNSFTVDCLFSMAPDRAGLKAGVCRTVPGHLHNNIRRWCDTYRPNVFLGMVSAMDEHGFCRFSLCNIQEKYVAGMADLVICEVNPNMPQIGGDTEIHISEIDYIVESDNPIPTIESGPISKIEETIGGYVASLIHDGDTLQLGIGGLPDAAAQALIGKHDLGIHTEMITNSMADLVEAGIVTNRKKNFLPGKLVGTFSLGSQRLYDMMHNNPSVLMLNGGFVNHPSIVAKNDNMVSVNTAIEVDLSGQVCSETIGTIHYSGSGGQNDMAEGAIHSKNGRSIIVLRSTAKKGTISTINAIHTPGAVVTLSRNNIDYIVTEYGIAPLRGRSVKERVDNLIAVAHPDFRPQLREDAARYQLI